jgi:hypothetical protein
VFGVVASLPFADTHNTLADVVNIVTDVVNADVKSSKLGFHCFSGGQALSLNSATSTP